MERARRASMDVPRRSYGETSPTKAFAPGSDKEYEARLEAIAREMMEKVERRDRMFHFKTYKQCFVGKDAVKFLVWSGHAANVAEALAVGNALMQRGVFQHVTSDHSFKNEGLFYVFKSDSVLQRALAGLNRSSVGNSSDSGVAGSVDDSRQLSVEPPEVLDERLDNLAKQLLESLPVKDRFWHLKTYKSCFAGKDVVKWLVDKGHAGNDIEAAAIGNALLRRGAILSAASNDVVFKGDDTLFRFRVHEETYLRGIQWLERAGLEARLEKVVRDLMTRLDIRDRAGRLVPHKSCFYGKDAVSCLLNSGHASRAEEAVTLGNALLQQGVFSGVTGDYPFRNEELLYRFKAHEEDGSAVEAMGGVSRASSVESLMRMGWGVNAGEELTEEQLEEKLQEAARAMLAGIEVKDRTWHLKVYKKTFVGREAVKFLIDTGFATTVDIALLVGNALIKRGVFANAGGDQPFKNEELLYRFKAHDEAVKKGLHWLSKSRGLDAKLEDSARAMMAKLPIRTRTHKFQRLRKCFVGREAVQFLIQQGFVADVDEALQLGNALMEKGVFSHATGEHAFKNEVLYYRFKAHEDYAENRSVNFGLRRRRSGSAKGRAVEPSRRFTKDGPGQVGEWDDMEQGAGGMEAAAVGGWRTIMQGLDELAISAVGVDSVLSAVELVGREYTASGLLHWGITHIVLALTYLEDALRGGVSSEEAVQKADELLGNAGRRCNEALLYKPDLYRAAMMIAVLHHLRAVMHSGLLRVRETMAFFNACLASGGLLALDVGENADMLSMSTAMEDGEDDPVATFLATQAASLSAAQASLQSEKVAAAEVHFQSAVRVLEALARMLPQEERAVRSRQASAGTADEEDGQGEAATKEQSTFETVADMWGMLLWEKSQIWAAVGRPWKPLLDQAVDKLREGGAQEADVDLLIACHIMAAQ